MDLFRPMLYKVYFLKSAYLYKMDNILEIFAPIYSCYPEMQNSGGFIVSVCVCVFGIHFLVYFEVVVK